MKRTPIATALLLLAASTYHAADAQTLKTREQVKAEWAAARDTGNLQADGESGVLLRDLHPGGAPRQLSADRAARPAVSRPCSTLPIKSLRLST